ncbi:MAG: CYTH domain-containing protein [Actinomycetota bacterium]|nr:CYTH domain-containing protein [Actinomycetota bacterium]
MIEEEVKLTTGPDFSVASYEGLVPGSAVDADRVTKTLTTYFDTSDFSMTMRFSSLRFRCALADLDESLTLHDGVKGTWTIKDGGESSTSDGVISVKRHEINVKGAFGDPLEELFSRAEVSTIERELLRPIARILSNRHSTEISLAKERVAIDDDVANVLSLEDNSIAHTFREIEVELLSEDGGLTLRNAVVAKLIEAGARYSESPSKLHLALSILHPKLGL